MNFDLDVALTIKYIVGTGAKCRSNGSITYGQPNDMTENVVERQGQMSYRGLTLSVEPLLLLLKIKVKQYQTRQEQHSASYCIVSVCQIGLLCVLRDWSIVQYMASRP